MRLVLRGPYPEERRSALEALITTDWSIAEWDGDSGKAALAPLLAEADALLAMSFGADMPSAPRLRLLQLPGAGFDKVEFAAVPDRCTVCNVYEHEPAIAEYVLAAMLGWVTRIARMDAKLRQGDWSDALVTGGAPHGELGGRTVGLIGYGHIGREVARRARAFDTRVIAVTRTPERADAGLDAVAGLDGLDRLLAEADFVVVCCPLTAATRGLIDAARLARMKPDAVLINVARGAIVDEKALFDACRERRIGGAVIDVWYRYPKDDGEKVLPSALPFHELDNVVMTPHASGWTDRLWSRRLKVIAGNLDRLARGEPLVNVLRAPGGPPPT